MGFVQIAKGCGNGIQLRLYTGKVALDGSSIKADNYFPLI